MRARVMKNGATYLNGTLYLPTTSVSQYKVIDYKEERQYNCNDGPDVEQGTRSQIGEGCSE